MGSNRTVSAPDISIGTISLVMLLLMTFGVIFLNAAWDVKFPTDRGALMFWLPLVLSTGFLFNMLLEAGRRVAIAGRVLGIALIVGIVAIFIRTANVNHTLIWWYDADTKAAMKILTALPWSNDSDLPRAVGEQTLGISPSLEPSVNYYIYTKNLWWLAFVDRSGVASRQFDYYYYFPEDRRFLSMVPLEQIAEFPVTGNMLARRGGAAGITP